MSSCDGNCGDCSSKKSSTPDVKGRPSLKKEPISNYLTPKPKPKKDTTPLDYPCKCTDYLRNMPRYTCVKCIKSWVEANNIEDAIEEANRLKGIGKSVAFGRIHEAIDEKRKRNLFKDSCSCKDGKC